MGGDDGQSKNKKKRDRSDGKSIEKVVSNEEEQKQQQGNGNPSKKKKSQESFPFGNYKNYYGYRVSLFSILCSSLSCWLSI